MLKTILISLVIAVLLVLGWHFVFPMMGGVLAITAIVWAAIVTSIVVFCTAILLLFIFSGVGLFLVGLFGFIWTVIAIILFPILFPILVPLLIVMLVITLIRRNSLKK